MNSMFPPHDAPAGDPRRSGALTRSETQVLVLAAEGLTSKEMAERLFISKRTVDFHLQNVYGKLGVRNRMEALHAASRRGLVLGS